MSNKKSAALKRRKKAEVTNVPTSILEQVAWAVRRLCTAASRQFGGDCALHASLSVELLTMLGYHATRKIGFAAWRVGDGDGDVIVHAPISGMVPQGIDKLPFHAWVELENAIFDPTTYQLKDKAKDLDLLDGGNTTVIWCPDYLFAAANSVSSLKAVTIGISGSYFYEWVEPVEKHVLKKAVSVSDEERKLVKLLFENPDMEVVGPNSKMHLNKSPFNDTNND